MVTPHSIVNTNNLATETNQPNAALRNGIDFCRGNFYNAFREGEREGD
jgi:hypothetical protein